jgi:hypothetical protein
MPGTLLTAVITGGGGTVTVNDDVAVAAIVSLNAQLTTLNALLATTITPTPGGKPVFPGLPGSIAQSLYHSKTTLAAQSKQLGEMNANLESMRISIGKTTTELEKLTKHAGIANAHANKANVIANLAVIDQLDKNQFDKQVVTETQTAAGQKPTVVPPTDLAANVQKKVSDIVNIDAAMAASGLIISTATTAATEGFALAQEIVLDTAIGKKLVEYYYEQQIAVTKLFSAKRAARLKAENDERLKALESGGVPAIPDPPEILEA